MHHRSTVVVLVALTIGAGGCLDATPVMLATQDAGLIGEGGVLDGGTDAILHPECHECIVSETFPDGGGGCGQKYQDCLVNGDRCIEIYNCAYAMGCVTMPSFGDSIACAKTVCADNLGITDVLGPSIQKAIALTYCFHTGGPCASQCEVSDQSGSWGALRAH